MKKKKKKRKNEEEEEELEEAEGITNPASTMTCSHKRIAPDWPQTAKRSLNDSVSTYESYFGSTLSSFERKSVSMTLIACVPVHTIVSTSARPSAMALKTKSQIKPRTGLPNDHEWRDLNERKPATYEPWPLSMMPDTNGKRTMPTVAAMLNVVSRVEKAIFDRL